MDNKHRPVRRPTIKDVAQLAGVSPMTVSRVVNTPQDVGEAKRRAVLEAIARLQYIPNKAAASLQRVQNSMVALLLPDLSHTLFHDIYRGLNSVLEPAGYLVLMSESHYDLAREYALAQSMLSWQPAGFVFSNILRDSRTAPMLANAGVPLCMLADPGFDSGQMVVGYSTYRIGAAVARYLFKLGRQRIGLVRSTTPYTRNTERMLEGARSVLPDFPGREVIAMGVPKTSPLSLDDGASVVRSLKSGAGGLSCDALAFVNDAPASGAVLECRRQGIRVPEDLAIVGFGDSDLAVSIAPALTTINVDAQQVGRSAARALLAHMGDPSASAHREEIEFRLISRETT